MVTTSEFVVAVRTRDRRSTIARHSLRVLEGVRVPVYIFCATSELTEYRAAFPHLHVRDGGTGGAGVCNARIFDAFEEGQRVLQCDDDVLDFVELRDGRLVAGDLDAFARRGFALLETHACKLFGFHAHSNARLMGKREELSTGLVRIPGGLVGFVNDRRLLARDPVLLGIAKFSIIRYS